MIYCYLKEYKTQVVNMADIGKRIKEKREALGMTQEELASKLGYKNKSSIAKIETGTNDIVQSKVAEFATVLDTTVAYLMGWDNERSEKKEVTLTPKDERDIAKRLDNTLSDLEDTQSALMFNGEPLDDETRELLKASLENSIRIAKINAKQKFTPKKYRTSSE